MTIHAKAFVSHSSKDKPLVEKVVERVSAARWEIDSLTFEEGKTSASEIFAALSRSDLFVLMASEHSVESDWVQSELEIAQQLLYQRKLGGILVFLIDGTLASKLPDWIRAYVYAKTSNETRIGNAVRTRLFQLDSKKGIKEKPFVQRVRIREEIEKKLADLTKQINGIYVSGVDGIGRRAIVSSTLRSLFPGTDVAGVEISIADGEGILEAYRKLYFAWNHPTADQARQMLDESSGASVPDLVSRTATLVKAIANEKTITWFEFDYAILDDAGNFDPAFRDLLLALESRRPCLVIRTKRAPKFQEARRIPNIAFIKVDGLSDEESRLLWVYSLEHFEFEGADPKFIQSLQDAVSGHPAMIWVAAEYVASMGRPVIEANPGELMEALLGLSLSLVDGLNLNAADKSLLSLFDDLGTVDPSDLIQISDEPDQVVSDSINKLMSLGLIESDGDSLRLASYFQNARFRKQFAGETDRFLTEARRRLLNIVSTYTGDDNISFATVDAAVTSAIAQGKAVPALFGERAVVGSHFLKVARAAYDREKYDHAIGFAAKALAKRESLTQSAIVECLRLLGMSAVRFNRNEPLEKALSGLAEIPTNQAKRHIHFIRGFRGRWSGDYDAAEREFLEVLKITPKDTHALREIAQVLVVKEDYAVAEGYARDALARTPGNAFVIDILLQCLIERKKVSYPALLEDNEIDDLFSQLELADRKERVNFFALRRAHFFSALNNPAEALKWADDAVDANPTVHAYAVRAEIKLAIRNDPEKLRSVDVDIRQIQKLADETKGARSHATLLAKLRIRFELAKGNLPAAIKQYEATSRILGLVKRKLALEIANEAVAKQSKDSTVVQFANHVLSSKH
jgi:tetratricopeptide (TPR) repeat protein